MRCIVTVAIYLTLLPPSASFGQYIAYAQVPEARVRRYWRDQAVLRAGGTLQARQFVETHGEVAAVALLSCSPPVARKLVAFSQEDPLARLGLPRDLLLAIGKPGNGDDVCLYVVNHAGELRDPDARVAFLSSPLEFALYLRPLSEGADAVRTARLSSEAGAMAWFGRISGNARVFAIAVGIVLLALLIRWRRVPRV